MGQEVPVSSSFQAILLEGLFYERDGSFYVEQDNGTHTSVTETLTPLAGKQVQVALHHLPPQVQPGLPGAGSCRFPQGIGCPVRHDLHPDRLLSFHLEGVLQPQPWSLVKFDGCTVILPLSGMVGHYGRLAATSVVDVEKMREALSRLDPSAFTSAGLGTQDLEEILNRLRRTTEN